MKKFIPHSVADMKKMAFMAAFIVAALFLALGSNSASAQTSDPVQSGSVGLTGTISAPPPASGATISFPRTGSNFTDKDLPVVVTGICPTGLLVKLFKNNVFAGSAQCINSSFSLQIDLFAGDNELIARVYDDLDQPGPDSNIVNVTFNTGTVRGPTRVSLTSSYAKRGSNPKEELTWPIVLTGGIGPYAFSVDWGDSSQPDLFTQSFPGEILLKHIYGQPGVYNIVIKVVDSNGVTAYLQLVGVANGPLSQEINTGQDGGTNITTSKKIIIWWPTALLIPFIISTFWLGKKYMLRVLKKRIERGEHPFE